jgi:hypothetical protein
LKGIPSSALLFEDGDRLFLFVIDPLSLFEETQVSPERKPSTLVAGPSSTLFPVRIE